MHYHKKCLEVLRLLKREAIDVPGLGNCCCCWPELRERALQQRPGDPGDHRHGEPGHGRGGQGREASYPGVGAGVWSIFFIELMKSKYFIPVITCVVWCQFCFVFFIWIYLRNIILSKTEYEQTFNYESFSWISPNQ